MAYPDCQGRSLKEGLALAPLEPARSDTPSVPHRPDKEMLLGAGDRVARSSARGILGAGFLVSTMQIRERMTYAHAIPRHNLYLTLDGCTQQSAGRIGRGEVVNRPDRAGALSFTPANWERRVEIGPGLIRCAIIELGTELIDEVMECARSSGQWSAPFNEADPKLFAMVVALEADLSSATPIPFWAETLLVAIARRTSLRFGPYDRRTDDGWLAPAALRRVVDCMEASIGKPASLSALAAEAGLGVSAFVRAFRGTTGATPAAFALERRLCRAEQLVRGTEDTLASIAAATGFASASHLVSTFRQRRGITPGALRGKAVTTCPSMPTTEQHKVR